MNNQPTCGFIHVARWQSICSIIAKDRASYDRIRLKPKMFPGAVLTNWKISRWVDFDCIQVQLSLLWIN